MCVPKVIEHSERVDDLGSVLERRLELDGPSVHEHRLRRADRLQHPDNVLVRVAAAPTKNARRVVAGAERQHCDRRQWQQLIGLRQSDLLREVNVRGVFGALARGRLGRERLGRERLLLGSRRRRSLVHRRRGERTHVGGRVVRMQRRRHVGAAIRHDDAVSADRHLGRLCEVDLVGLLERRAIDELVQHPAHGAVAAAHQDAEVRRVLPLVDTGSWSHCAHARIDR